MQDLLNNLGLSAIDFSADWSKAYLSIQNSIEYFAESRKYVYYDEEHNIIKCYTIVSRLSERSGYNFIDLCMHEGKYFIIRSTKNEGIEYQLDSFIENIKTIYLYSWQKHNYPDFKIFPELYAFGYSNKKYYLIMEYISDKYSIEMLPKLTEIMQHLSQIKFRHGDLTHNNILIQNDSPIIIDFGFSSFCINDIWFGCSKAENVLNYEYKYPAIRTKTINSYNIIHDLIILMYSLQPHECNYEDISIIGVQLNMIIIYIATYIAIYYTDASANRHMIKELLYFNEPGYLDLVKDAYIFFDILPREIYSLLFT